MVVTTGAISRAKLQSNHHHQQTNIQFLQDGCPSCRPTNSIKALNEKNITFHGLAYSKLNQQCQCTEGNNITFPGLVYPKLTWGLPTLYLTTNSSWLPWGRVAMPLISPLMPVTHFITHKLKWQVAISFCLANQTKVSHTYIIILGFCLTGL